MLDVAVSATYLKTKCARQTATEAIKLEKVMAEERFEETVWHAFWKKAFQAQGESVLFTNTKPLFFFKDLNAVSEKTCGFRE